MKSQNSAEQWDNYVAKYENGKPGSTTLRMDLIEKSPLKELPYLVVTGITFETNREDGFPGNDIFPIIHKISDELLELISRETETILVGSFMHDQERLEYFYVANKEGLQEKIEKYYQENYSGYEFYLNIKEDQNWEYYTEFLYPNQETLNYMADQSVIRNLYNAGDPLTKERSVNHWMYFSTESNMLKCKKELENKNFMIQNSGVNQQTNLPFELQFSRMDKVDINSIFPITSELRKIAKEYNGEYDGWDTSIEVE
ncbi:uncharacterized protein (TIGR01619 family) [Salegentibacter sp. 24]|uniref:DUF695 domain-containing protein n=1 Tax=Salegentibacter sp. 24 TaxID=2183986 RepID=UPI0010CEFF27|nr:DUF695 domain-containing protein [Salegentibacter sp. 24]TDN79070.1 uncharacterized protein (TIGR01619 family) [Salegentibacter sp. 24]